jgi:hypothetical protein
LSGLRERKNGFLAAKNAKGAARLRKGNAQKGKIMRMLCASLTYGTLRAKGRLRPFALSRPVNSPMLYPSVSAQKAYKC